MTLQQMLDHAREAVELASGREREDLDDDRLLNLGLVRLVEVVGEAANRLPHDFQAAHPEMPWADAIGMRNRLAHGYDTVDFDVLWATVQEDLPLLVQRLDSLLGG